MTDRQWFDEYTRHIVDTELYAEARATLAEDMLTKLNKELKSVISSYGIIRSKTVENECRRECDECIRRHLDEWKNEENKERQSQAESESSWLSDALKSALGVAVAASALRIRRALEAPFSETDTFDTFAEGLKDKVRKSIRTPLLSARIFGSGGSAVAESLDSAMLWLKRETKANMRTAVTSVQRNVQRLLLADNRRIRFKYISMLDDRVCVVCGGYSGTVYEDLSEAPAVPVHIRCRCFYLPVLSSTDDDGEETYQEWFDRQPDSVQYKILGPTRYAFYKGGITHIEKFTSEGRKLTLEELYTGTVDIKKPKQPYDGIWKTEKVTKMASVHIAKERLEDGMKDPLVFGSDKMMTKTLAKYSGKDVWLLPEIHKEKGMTNPDAFFEGANLEMKHVRGDRRKVGLNACRALLQADNIFLYVEKDISPEACLSAIKGALYNTKQQAKKIKVLLLSRIPKV